MDRHEANSGTSVVLLYHRIGRPRLGSLVAGQYVAPSLFRRELDFLTTHGWRQVSLSEMIEKRGSEAAHGENEFCLTFDDGYLSVYEHARPALQDRGMTATVYVVAGSVGGINGWDRSAGDHEEPMMSAAQVRELAESGFEIGSHTLTHPHLTEVDDDQLRRELQDSKRALEDIIGKEVTSFSYPYGDYDSRVLDTAIDAGYKNAVATRLGVVLDGTSAFEVPRVNVRWNAIGLLLARKINRARRASGVR